MPLPGGSDGKGSNSYNMGRSPGFDPDLNIPEEGILLTWKGASESGEFHGQRARVLSSMGLQQRARDIDLSNFHSYFSYDVDTESDGTPVRW